MLPYLENQNYKEKIIATFGGVNKKETINDNEFSEMKNMSLANAPMIGTRPKRGEVIKTLTKPNGLGYKNGLVYVDGTSLYWNDNKVATVTDTKKIIVGMGAYFVVWPDKIQYNTETEELENLEYRWTQSSTATFEQLNEGSTLVKITCTGIGTNLSEHDGVEISGCTNDDFNKATIITEKTDNYIIITGILDTTFTQTSGLKIERTIPDMDYICESNNRIWGCSSENHEIYASKLGDAKNWKAFEGISTDSYAVTVGSDGDFTGCLSHLGVVLFFKEYTIHKIYGDKPSNYQVNTNSPMRGPMKGCERTSCVVNETLMYVARNDICTFDGAQPDSIGEAVKSLAFEEGVASQYDGKYYASLKDKNGNWNLYIYDMTIGTWMIEDDVQLAYMEYAQGILYCIDVSGNMFEIYGNREETIEWNLETGIMMENTIKYKSVNKILFHFELDSKSEVNAYIQYDSEPQWKKCITYKAKERKTHIMTVAPRRCRYFKIKLDGVGTIKLIAMSISTAEGSELSGNV